MREEIRPDTQPAPEPTGTPGGPSVPGVPPIYGPPATQPNPVAGLHGSARWEATVRSALSMFGGRMWSRDYNMYVLSLQDDPNDPEYNTALAQAKVYAQKFESGQTPDAVGSGAPSNVGTPLVGPGQVGHMAVNTAIPQPVPPGSSLHEPKTPSGLQHPKVQKLNEVQEQKQAMQEIRRNSGDIFTGTPASDQSLATPTGTDPILAQFMDVNGKLLTGPQAEMAKRSGSFVYMGMTTSTTEHGYTAQKNQWMFVQDAYAGLAAQGPEKVKQYQGMLGVEQTGILNNDADGLQSMWNAAVKQAQLYAVAGLKVSVQEIFDSYLRSTVAAKKSRGGGGSFIGDNPVDIAAIDYYRAMMQILGDISGMPTPGGRG